MTSLGITRIPKSPAEVEAEWAVANQDAFWAEVNTEVETDEHPKKACPLLYGRVCHICNNHLGGCQRAKTLIELWRNNADKHYFKTKQCGGCQKNYACPNIHNNELARDSKNQLFIYRAKPSFRNSATPTPPVVRMTAGSSAVANISHIPRSQSQPADSIHSSISRSHVFTPELSPIAARIAALPPGIPISSIIQFTSSREGAMSAPPSLPTSHFAQLSPAPSPSPSSSPFLNNSPAAQIQSLPSSPMPEIFSFSSIAINEPDAAPSDEVDAAPPNRLEPSQQPDAAEESVDAVVLPTITGLPSKFFAFLNDAS